MITPAARLTCASLLLCLLAKPAQAQSSVDSTLHWVDSLYAAGSYSLAELEARRLLENQLLSDSIRIVSEQWVAFALVAQEKSALATEHFINILRLQPSRELDPVLTSPKILAVFNDARAKFFGSRAKENVPAAGNNTIDPERITFRTILFPGWEQLYHGRTTTGAVFVGAGAVTLASGIVLEFLRSSARREYLYATAPDEIESKYNTYNRYSKAEAYSFAAFAVVYLASEIDIFTHYSSFSLSSVGTGPPTVGAKLLLSFPLP